ncbi:aminopeptidase P family protein [Portibacter marinus]|uniref:aminopeptidase P family protein n=1 Tax=Portibacter marinus TaxID=2898660 RepID=UPI001F3A6949|nr:aminopeptidase P family protein [Portibacter marinus]
MKLSQFKKEVYVDRRKKLAHKIPGGKIFLQGNRESSVNFKDNWYPFRQDSTFLYYCGLNIANLDVIIDANTGETTLYGNDLSIDDIVWTGPLPNLEELAERVGIEKVKPLANLNKDLDGNLHFLPPYRPLHEMRLQGLGEPSEELIEAVVNQRNKKSPEEIEALHEACTRTSRMHFEVMANAKRSMKEYELIAIAQAYARGQNADFSFLPICTTQGHILHNHSYDNTLNSGDMVLFDGGLESNQLYAGDMTRTFPVDRKFTAMQADLYQIVLNAQKTAIRNCKAGAKFVDIHLASSKTLAAGLIELGIMKGDAEEAVAQGAHTMFFQCGLGHLMGLDVHDMENLGEQFVGYGGGMLKSKEFGLKSLRLGRSLEEGFVITIEPGIYIIPQLIDMWEAEGKYSDFIDYKALNHLSDFGGIRIEDDYVITESGLQLLGEPLAKEIKEVEEIRAAANQ